MDEGVARRGGNDVGLRWRTRSAGCGQWRRRLDERAESTPRARQVPGRHRQMRQGLLRRSRWGGLREWRVLRSTALPLAGAAFESRTTDSGLTERALGLWLAGTTAGRERAMKPKPKFGT